MFIAEVGKVHQIFQADRSFFGKRIGFADKHMGLGRKEGGVGQPIVIQHLDQNIPIEIIEEENPDFGPEIFDIIDDFPGPCFSQKELVVFHIGFFQETDKGIDHKGIVLGRDTEEFPAVTWIFVAFLQEFSLLYHLAGIRKELNPILGHGNALGIAVEDFDTHLLFQVLDGIGQTGLGDKELLGCFVHGASFSDFNDVV